MAYAIVHHFPGATQEQYEAALDAVHPSRDALPDGQIHHYAGPSGDGWVVVAVHDSRESWERFKEEVLMPGLRDLGDRGPAGPPHAIGFEVVAEKHAPAAVR